MESADTTKRRTGRVLLIYTGGTIGMGCNPVTKTLEPLDFDNLLSHMPEFRQIETKVDVHQFAQPIDSSDMNPAIWADIVKIISGRYDQYDGFVILHGTDTMAYTASALSFMLQNLGKPVILTGSQLPIGLLRTDGKENLVTSIELAAACDPSGHAMVPEVAIYFSGRLLRGNRCTKQSAEGFNAFESYNYPALCDAGVNFRFNEPYILRPDYSRPLVPCLDMDPSVLVFSLFPGMQEEMFRSILQIPQLKGIVMRSFGAGNSPHQPWLLSTMQKAVERGITVVNVSQCMAGTVEMGLYSNGQQLEQAGIISGRDSTVEAAVTKLMYLNARYSDPTTVMKLMQTSLCGEITVSES